MQGIHLSAPHGNEYDGNGYHWLQSKWSPGSDQDRAYRLTETSVKYSMAIHDPSLPLPNNNRLFLITIAVSSHKCHGINNHWQLDSLLESLLGMTTKATYIKAPHNWDHSMIGGFTPQKGSNMESVFMPQRLHVLSQYVQWIFDNSCIRSIRVTVC